MKRINEAIKNNTYNRVYLLYGPESFLRLSYTKKLCDAILPESDNMNRISFDGDKISESAIVDFAETMPFFAERRLIRIKDSGFFKTSTEILPDYMSRIPEYAVIVFSETEIDKRNKLYKAVQKYGYVSEFATQKDDQLMRWGAGILARAGMKITASDMSYLLMRTGPDMNHLSLEIDKVISYCQGRNVVTRSDIEAVTGTQIENHIFDMIDAVTSRNQKKALDLYADLLALKEPPMRILFLIVRQFNQLLMIKELAAAGNSVPMIAQKTGIRDFVVRRSMNTIKGYSAAELRGNIAACAEMEEAVKTGNITDRLSVELLLIRFSARTQ